MTHTIISDAQTAVMAIMDKARQTKPQSIEERDMAKAAELAVAIASELGFNIANGHSHEGDYKQLERGLPESFYQMLAEILRPAQIYVSQVLEVIGHGKTLLDAKVQHDFDQWPMPGPVYYAHTGPAEAIIRDLKAGDDYDGEVLATL